ncbi:flagellar hook-length control protein FliK [Sphingomonas sp. SORGH_AS_0879]|uniref:flagellar hook-length control protein FliK n=1 Tax=Sphingomonas sp. SORGH_AS_0879 TaxID=3041790 RepID=UPI00277DB47D|nr:flagellar hook-length control protein FliK [Sphingomonas sp. SORGH_AS_0879]MDQ1229056.1 flagellar hook-length control protein FliK [Sphingomonas sp. SORGH_AS_0879]
MSAIPSPLTLDALHPGRSLSAKPGGTSPAGDGNPGKFSDLLAIASPAADVGGLSLVTEDDDSLPETSDKAAADPGNPLPGILPMVLPVFADVPPPPQYAAPVASGEAAATVIAPQDGTPRIDGNTIVATPRGATDPGAPRLDAATPPILPSDTAMLDVVANATGQVTDMPTPAARTTGFRLVAAQPRVETDTDMAALSPAMPSGPLSVLQPAQGAPVIGLLAETLRHLSTPPEDRDEPSDRAPLTVAGAADPVALAATDGARPVVATTATADQAPLDMTQHHWPQAMIDRIDRMREDAATADTRIQLSPDALGGIAVAIRRDDDRTHIHFTAEQAHTATILADAHATLAQLAEDKGMRLGSMAVQAGATGGSDLGQSARDQRPSPPPAPMVPARPRAPEADPFRESASGDPAATATTRIA